MNLVKVKDNKPMMSDEEVDIIDHLLIQHAPNHCLEWGSGGSTLYFPTLSTVNSWLAVEENGHYVEYLKPLINDKTHVIWAAKNEWYVDCVKHSRNFDFILIDGYDRERCLEVAREIVSKDGIILLHDSGREEYQEMIRKHKGQKLIDGEEPLGDYYKHRGLHLFRRQRATPRVH